MFFYSLLMIPLGRFLSFVSKFHKSFRAQGANRFLSRSQFRHLRELRSQYQSCTLFFTSSAGEYEQAKPMIDRLQNDKSVLCVIVFFSESGVRFAKAQGESCTFLKAPWDDWLHWRRIFDALDPNRSFVVRYELWPAFLSHAKAKGSLFLINGVSSPSMGGAGISSLVRRYLLRYFDQIFVVSQNDQKVFEEFVAEPSLPVTVSGDTKYDRVRERITERKAKLAEVEGHLSPWTRKKRLILGSAWQDELNLCLRTFDKMGDLAEQWQLIVAPHDISEGMVNWVREQCEGQGLSVCLYSDRSLLNSEVQVLLVDCLGVLPEFYGCADVAVVGGAMHHRVHNVLEPAVRGLYLSFGPRYDTSKEAIVLVESQLAKVLESEDDLMALLNDSTLLIGEKNLPLVSKVEDLCGAADKIFRQLEIGQ